MEDDVRYFSFFNKIRLIRGPISKNNCIFIEDIQCKFKARVRGDIVNF
jgi:hypothetical protein